MSSESADQNADATSVRDKFTYNNTILVPDRGTITVTVDSSRPNDFAFIVNDADGNLLGDGVLSDLEFSIQSFHINQQPEQPAE